LRGGLHALGPSSRHGLGGHGAFHSVYLLGCLVFSGVAALVVARAGPCRAGGLHALLDSGCDDHRAAATAPRLARRRVRALEPLLGGVLRRVYPYSYVLAGAVALIALIAVRLRSCTSTR
jgi:hypothetical protein